MAARPRVVFRPAEALDEEIAQAFLGAAQVVLLLVHGPEDLVGWNTLVERADEPGEAFFTDERIDVRVEKIHHLMLCPSSRLV